jgi:hypothetical protein
MKDKRGMEILTETVIFIILNLVFLGIMIAFIFLKTSPTGLVEQDTAKQLALLIDAAEPGAEIILDAEEIVEIAKKNGISEDEAVKIVDNRVSVKLSEKSGYEYSFFNDVSVVANVDFSNNILFLGVEHG